MGILDSLKTAAADGLKKAASATTKAVATSSTKAMESVIAKTTALVGSKLADAVIKDLGASSPNTTPSPNTPSSPNPAASAKAAALVGSKATKNEQSSDDYEENIVTYELSYAEVEAIIEAKVREKGNPSNWRYSVVDLMTALGMNSSLASRKTLAARLNYSGYDADGSAEKNNWLHAELLKVLARNRGEVPSYLQ